MALHYSVVAFNVSKSDCQLAFVHSIAYSSSNMQQTTSRLCMSSYTCLPKRKPNRLRLESYLNINLRIHIPIHSRNLRDMHMHQSIMAGPLHISSPLHACFPAPTRRYRSPASNETTKYCVNSAQKNIGLRHQERRKRTVSAWT